MTPLQLLDRWGFCPFCVSIKSHQSYIRVLHDPGGYTDCPSEIITRPVKLTEWLHSCVTENFVDFEMDGYQSAFVPVAVVHNTPLCSVHLWNETDPTKSRLRIR